ncbi:MAG: type IVB secretion system apparatus protein IcmL/DotI [Proteobacteria bacterium]|nr:type IVB secretion system apparatus protein IcmL/DotI [Pseudomonadota bacterium]
MTMAEQARPSLDQPKYIGTLEMILLRNHYYYDSYRKLMIICICLLFIITMLAFFLRYEIKEIQPPSYFATSIDGSPLPLIPLGLPNLQDNALKTWAMEAAIEAYNMNFVNYRYAIQKARAYFTPAGFENYLKAIQESRNLDALKRKKMIVYAQINGTPEILKDSNSDPNLRVNGKFAWRVQIPVIVTYENSIPEDRIIQTNILTMLITRMSPLESPIGVGIDSFVIREVLR